MESISRAYYELKNANYWIYLFFHYFVSWEQEFVSGDTDFPFMEV